MHCDWLVTAGAVLLEKAGLSHFWEANVPWGEWPTAFSQEPFLEPPMAQVRCVYMKPFQLPL